MTKCRPSAKAERQRAQTIDVARGFEEQVFSSKMLEQNGDGRPLWESLWPSMIALDVARARVTAKSFNDAKKYGTHAELFFFLLQNMRHERERERDPIEPGHVSNESWFFAFPFTRLAE